MITLWRFIRREHSENFAPNPRHEITNDKPKRTRAERKAARNAMFARMSEIEKREQERQNKWMLTHPVSAGLIPIVDYIPPR